MAPAASRTPRSGGRDIDADLINNLMIAAAIGLLIVSLGVHEAAHGWVALKCGDTTARDLGRITLNPIPHIDIFMTIVLPLVMFFSSGFIFGGAKPVPVNFHALRRPYRDMALVALAGPASNFLLAIFFYFWQKLLVEELAMWDTGSPNDIVLGAAVQFNLLLAAFNLLPIPPLDGSRVMTWLLPAGLREAYVRLEAIGMLLVVVAIFGIPQVRVALGEVMDLMEVAVRAIVSLGGLW